MIDSRHITRLLDQGAQLSCRVVEAGHRAPPGNRVRVEIEHQTRRNI
jgi:hypothetical protein